MDATDLLDGLRIVPVVVIDDPASAVALAGTLLECGLRAIEVTLRTEGALAAIELIAAGVPEVLVGAGSLRRTEQVRQVIDAGARFAVSPGATEALLDEVAAAELPFGVLSGVGPT